jgi:outer membrane protein TolC
MASRGYAQDSLAVAPVADTSMELPPLEQLIDSAISHDPQVHYQDLQTLTNEYKERISRKDWAKNIGFQSDVRYGTFDNFSTNTGEGQTPSILATRTSQTNYGFGMFLKVPIDVLVNRKSQVKMARTAVEQAEDMAEAQRRNVRQLVIRQYHDVLLKQSILKIKSKSLGIARINMTMIERQFQNRMVDVAEFARVTEIASGAEAAFESARFDYKVAYMILEEIVGFKFE